MSTTQLKTIAKLAVITKEFSTYYIPGKTLVQGKLVNQIDEQQDYYFVLDSEGDLLTKVSKKVPCLVDYTNIFEVPDIDALSADLVSFGNFLFDTYKIMIMSNDGTNAPVYKREVTHADLMNWQSTFTN